MANLPPQEKEIIKSMMVREFDKIRTIDIMNTIFMYERVKDKNATNGKLNNAIDAIVLDKLYKLRDELNRLPESNVVQEGT